MRLESRLKISESQSTGSSLLWAQWCFDKALVARSLNAINLLFPHYSLHESTHSNAIISEIERILGPNIENLSFIDSWLLLEASYWHDIGMIVTHEEKKKIIEDPNFRDFLAQMSTSENDYSGYAQLYVKFLSGESTDSVLDLEKSFAFLLSEFIRRIHPERSKQILLNPESIGIKSPDTGLINSRLFVLLGDIIVCHGENFTSVLNLPFENDGLEVGDIAHPRLVASLLRLGDLLDLDDGRHCPTQLLTVGKLPTLSKAHLDKHRSIVSKSVTSNSIAILAKCKTFESFEVQNDWFSYIEKEIEDQDRHWGDIAPMKYIGKLPTIKSLICDLEDSIPLGRKSSRFSLDSNRIYNYLTGNSIYENPLVSILEVLQNSVDATIDRIWLENQKEIMEIDDFQEKAESFPIEINVSHQKVSSSKVEYLIAIIDHGKGMTLNDIRSALTIASDQCQDQKEKYRKGMPSWMRPSGFFGIGLQSVFSVSDQITIETQSAGDSPYEIVIRSTPGKTPSFVVKKKKSNKWKFGTNVQFIIMEDSIPNQIFGNLAATASLAKFDPLNDLVLNAKKFQIKEQVAEFAQFCQFPVCFNGEKLKSEREQFKIRDTFHGIEYAIEFSRYSNIYDWQFRGRPFKTSSFFNYFNIRGNIFSGRADDFLPLSREKIHKAGQKLLNEKIGNSLIKMKSEILAVVTDKTMASFYYFLQDSPNSGQVDELLKNIELSNRKLEELLAKGPKIWVTFEMHVGELIPELKDVTVIGETSIESKMLIQAALKLGLGVVIHKIQDFKAISPRNGVNGRAVCLYQIEFVKDNNFSRIEDDAIKYLSDKKLSDSLTRYWLPCGAKQFPFIEIDASIRNQYSWVSPLTPFHDFFPMGLFLKSTSKSLVEDMPILVKEVRKHRKSLSDVQIESALKQFYSKFSFETKQEINDILKPRNKGL